MSDDSPQQVAGLLGDTTKFVARAEGPVRACFLYQ